jgi:RNA polymerase sigma-70 factor (ECF subfamily)
VTQKQETYLVPWWEAELPEIRRELLSYLRRHLPALTSEHDDLLNDTFLALTKQIQQKSASLPQSWFRHSTPTNESESSHLHKLATVILKRRIADLFRKRASHPTFFPIEDIQHEIPDPHPQASDRGIILSKMLEVVLNVLDEMPSEDRDLVAFVSRNIGLRQGLNARDRQRLHRVRNKLKDEIARHLGAEAVELLRIAD